VAAVEYEVRNRVALVTLNDPDKRNMLSEPMVDELVAAVDRAEASDDVGAIVVTGAPPAFCAGANLGRLGQAGEGARQAGSGSAGPGLRTVYEAFLRFSRSDLPTVAAVNGAAVGAGMNLALCCDVRLVGASARFDTRFVELGLHPGGGHTWMLRRAVGPQTAAAMVLFGQVLDSEGAVERGLAWARVEDGDLVDAAVELAARAASAPRELTMRVKQTMRAVEALDEHDAAVDTELEAQTWSVAQPWFAERLAAVQARVSRRS
jgi:enoyl-CoA hydratase